MSRKHRPIERPEHNNWTDEGRMTPREMMIAAAVIAVTLLLVLVTQSCSTCEPECCADCPTLLQPCAPVPPEIITVLPPEVTVPPKPSLESLDNAALAMIDPAAWLRMLAQDFAELAEALDMARGELEAVNAARIE